MSLNFETFVCKSLQTPTNINYIQEWISFKDFNNVNDDFINKRKWNILSKSYCLSSCGIKNTAWNNEMELFDGNRCFNIKTILKIYT